MAWVINTAKIKEFCATCRARAADAYLTYKVGPLGRLLRRSYRLTKKKRLVSPLMVRILAVNVMALAILVGSVLYLGRYQERLISSELESLRLQARLAASALGEGAVVIDDEEKNILSPLLSRLMIRRMVEANDTRTRLYEPDNSLIADSRLLQGRTGKIQVQKLPNVPQETFWAKRWVTNAFDFVDHLVEQQNFAPYPEEEAQRGATYDIVKRSLNGEPAAQVWSLPKGGLVLAVAVPVQRYKQVLGALMLSKPDKTIAVAIRDVRLDILKIFVITLFITTLLSLYLARAIGRPIKQLALAAEGLRHGQAEIVGLRGTAHLLKRELIPDFSARHDEIGDLSSSLRDMTEALSKRMRAIENFAADVSHELKNPLTSLRSAVETAGRIHDPEMQGRLMAVVRDDVDRMDRLITDIAHASRLDAELSRDEAAPIDVRRMLTTLVDFYHVTNEGDGIPRTQARVILKSIPDGDLMAMGVEARLVQVLQNLIGNALSFAPVDSEVWMAVDKDKDNLYIAVSDCGPGIPENKLTAVFDRFYTERPKAEKFGTHSGLGLSISKQIVEAHRGRIWAQNRIDDDGKILGACFIVALPMR